MLQNTHIHCANKLQCWIVYACTDQTASSNCTRHVPGRQHPLSDAPYHVITTDPVGAMRHTSAIMVYSPVFFGGGGHTLTSACTFASIVVHPFVVGKLDTVSQSCVHPSDTIARVAREAKM